MHEDVFSFAILKRIYAELKADKTQANTYATGNSIFLDQGKKDMGTFFL